MGVIHDREPPEIPMATGPAPGTCERGQCDGSGLILAHLRLEPIGQFGFKCGCHRGRGRKERLPAWDDSAREKYEKIR